jgi:hypothetical protein
MVDILSSFDGRYLGLDAAGRLLNKDYNDTGDPKVVAKKLYASVAASTALTASSTETEFDQSYTIPGNLLQVGSLLRIRYQGIATATNSTDTLTAKLYIGGKAGTALQASAATDVANNNIFAGEFYMAVRTIGATGTIVGWGSYVSALAASGTATMVVGILASTTLDTTAAQKIAVSGQWSTTSASNSARLDYMSVEIL